MGCQVSIGYFMSAGISSLVIAYRIVEILWEKTFAKVCDITKLL